MDEYDMEGMVDDPGLPENPTETSGDNSSRINGYAISDDIDSTDTDNVVLCLFYHSEKLAGAVYYAETSEMQIMYDITDPAPDFKILCSLFLQLKPTQVVTCPSLSEWFLRKVNSLVSGENVTISPTVDPPAYSEKLHFIPTKEFRRSSCKRSILGLKLPSEPEDTSEVDRHTYIMSLIDLSAQVLVSAVGGLLYFLKRFLCEINLVAAIDTPILSIRTLSLKDIVWVDEETMHALRIFSPVLHPSSFKWSYTGSKEGFSVFSILNRCHSTPGAKYMRVMLSQPTKDIDVIRRRHEVISFCLKSINEQTVRSLADSVVHIKSVLKILTRMTNAQASVRQWKAFYDTIYNVTLVGEVCRANSKDVKFFQEISDSLCGSIFLMSHCINRIIDFEKSLVHSRIVLKEGISDDLDRLKENQSHVITMMNQIAEQELQDLPEYIQSCSLLHIPESGYFLIIPLWDSDLNEDQLKSVPDLHFQFVSSGKAHYKSSRCYELDSLLGDWHAKVVEIESKIILKLVQYIQRNIAPLVKLTGLIAELDCLLALSKAARDFNLVRPHVTSDKEIHIQKGRHILQELCVDMFVPNDTHSSRENGFIKILTGPNASGKSVYLKQVALIVYLAQIGSYVPAEKATIGIVDQIHTRIQLVDAVGTQLSTFMVDLRQMSLAIRNSTSNSLVIIDEFGKGTSEVDGLGILAASLEHFVEKKNDSPHLFVSTHFHSLSNLLPLSDSVKLQHLEHMVDKGELVYLYRLREGAVAASFALQVAQTHSLTRSNVDRATQILNGLKTPSDLTADSNNKLAILTSRRRAFLQNLSITELNNEKMDELKKELVSLCL